MKHLVRLLLVGVGGGSIWLSVILHPVSVLAEALVGITGVFLILCVPVIYLSELQRFCNEAVEEMDKLKETIERVSKTF